MDDMEFDGTVKTRQERLSKARGDSLPKEDVVFGDRRRSYQIVQFILWKVDQTENMRRKNLSVGRTRDINNAWIFDKPEYN